MGCCGMKWGARCGLALVLMQGGMGPGQGAEKKPGAPTAQEMDAAVMRMVAPGSAPLRAAIAPPPALKAEAKTRTTAKPKPSVQAQSTSRPKPGFKPKSEARKNVPAKPASSPAASDAPNPLPELIMASLAPPSAAGSAAAASADSAALVPAVPLAPGQERSVSSSKQFLIDGGDLNLRGALSFFLDEVRSSFVALLQDREQWKIPVVVRIVPNEAGLASAMASEVSQFASGGYHLKISLRMGPDFRQELLAREVLQMLMAERSLRNAKAVTAPNGRILPPWLLEGVAEALAYKKRGGPDAVFAALFRHKNLPAVTELLSAQKEGDDILSRATFRAACGALVLALLDQPDGPARFRRMLGDMATVPDQGEPMLRQHFPGFNGSVNRLSKWWSLQLAQISQKTDVFDVMPPAETERRLQAILVLRMVVGPDGQAPREKGTNFMAKWFQRGKELVGLDKSPAQPPPAATEKEKEKEKGKAAEEPDQRMVTVPLEEFIKLKGRNDSRTILVALDERLNEVLARGFPLHRPLALAYHEVILQLLQGDDKQVPTTLARLAAERKRLLEQMKGVESHLDWHLATQTSTRSGAFDDYFKAVREVAASPKRNDAISGYLDELEKEWEPVQ